MRKKSVSIMLLLTLLAALVGAIPVASQQPELTAARISAKAVSSVSAGAGKDATAAVQGRATESAATENQSRSAYLAPVPSELEPVSIIVTYEESFDPNALAAASGGQIVYRYDALFNGASMILASDKVDDVASLAGVTKVYLDEVVDQDTDASPEFIGAPTIWSALGGQEYAGEGVVVGIIDSGIWPEHPSFSDPDPYGKPYPPPPITPGANGFAGGTPRSTCDFGNMAWNPDDAPFTCNNKLIGAYRFQDTYDILRGLAPDEFASARDSDGHGTHTASTAAGNAGVMPSIFGVPYGAVSGVAPRAHVIMYRTGAGSTGSSFFSDLAAAIEQATLDGVDALNYSISGGTTPYGELPSLAFLSAYENGVFVAASAGNSGPGADTVAHREPWVTTVAASTQSRSFEGRLHVEAGGDTLDLTGVSVTHDFVGDVVLGADYGDPLCGSEDGVNPFAPGTFTANQIVVCERGIVARVEKSFNVWEAGAGGMVLYNPEVQSLNSDNHYVPTVHLDNVAGVALLDFMSTHTGIVGSIDGGNVTFGQGDVMAAFSSRGGPGQALGISKPDITAPGVQILAGHTPVPAWVTGGPPGQLFQAVAGTSMSAPHLAGAAALLKDMHPDWTPGQIKSALMMTALTDGVVKEDGVTPADPFDFGSGRVDLTQAGDATATISASAQDFIDHQNDLWNTNYPSLYVPVMPGQVTVQRTIHNETDLPRNWKLTVSAPADVSVTTPEHVQVAQNGDATFDITVDARNVALGEVRHATIEFKQGYESLHFPITIVRNQPAVLLDKSCDPAELPKRGTTDCTITIENTSYDDAIVSLTDQLPRGLQLVSGSVVGATEDGNGVAFDGTLAAAIPGLRVIDTVPLYGYIPLSAFGVAPMPPPSNPDDGAYVISGLDFLYQGVQYTDAIWSVNGTLEVGTASGVAASASNRFMPDPAIPNNLLAAWWTDLDLSTSGNWYLGALTDGVNVFDIFEWENVPRFGDPTSTASFQIWLVRGTNLAWFTYGGFTGSVADGTIGVENADGTFGYTYYYGEGGVGAIPTGDLHVDQNSGIPGETHVITFTAMGWEKGAWQNCAKMTSDLFFGTNIACFSGAVTSQ
jgi:uncharacterized repeat protein (TIGR01451 family)